MPDATTVKAAKSLPKNLILHIATGATPKSSASAYVLLNSPDHLRRIRSEITSTQRSSDKQGTVLSICP